LFLVCATLCFHEAKAVCFFHLNKEAVAAEIKARSVSAKQRHINKLEDLVARFSDPAQNWTARDIYQKLLGHLTKKMNFEPEVAQEIADEYSQLITAEKLKNNASYANWPPMELRLISDWNMSRAISRTIDYIALRTDLTAKQKADTFDRVKSEYKDFEGGRYDSYNDDGTSFHLFTGPLDVLQIHSDGKVFRGKIGTGFGLFSGTVPPDTLEERKPRRTLDRLFRDRPLNYSPSIFDSIEVSSPNN
jgi:hypothetical protein